MSRVNTLSSAKNRELFTKLKNGDTSVRETIIKGNINLVYYTFSRYFKNLEVKEYEDLGLIGLIKAVDSYDVEKNADFATFSIICIKNEILGELKKISKTKGDVSLYDGKPSLIEDDEDIRESIRILLESENYIINEGGIIIKQGTVFGGKFNDSPCAIIVEKYTTKP